MYDDTLFFCDPADGCGINDLAFPGRTPSYYPPQYSSPGASIFTNAVSGMVHVPGGPGGTGTYTPSGGSPVTLTNVPLSSLDASPTALGGYDTAILYQTCDIGASVNAPALAEINAFLNKGGKVMIFDADGCAPSSKGAADWSGFVYPFTTNNPGPKGASGTYTAIETTPLTAGLTVGESDADAQGDANVFTTHDSRWFQAIGATNANNVNGTVEAYARAPSGGLALYSGEDFWYTDDGPSAHLKQVFDNMLTQQWSPDSLPGTSPVCTNNCTGAAGGEAGTRVVLVTGLHDSTLGQAPGGNCKVGSFEAMCQQLTKRGFLVSVVSSSAGGRDSHGHPTVIDNRGAIDDNARRLGDTLRASRTGPALLVGHSMGGVIARVAVSRYGAPAVGLFTIGAPHDGSYGADIALGAIALPCSPPDLICNAVRAGGAYAAAYFGPAAVIDLSQASRWFDNANLSAPTVPVWVFAGEACPGPNFFGYLWPNDGIVGESSALGHGANLGKTKEYTWKSWHEPSLEAHLSGQFGCMSGGPTELTDQHVIDEVLAAATQLTPAGSIAAHSAAEFSPSSLRASASAARSVTVSLASASSRTLKPGALLPSGPRTAVLSTQKFSLKCGQRTVPALPALGARLFGTPAGDAPCAHPRLGGTHRLKFTTTSNPTNVRAIIRTQGTRVLVTVSARGLRSLSVRIGNRTLAGHRRGATATVTIRRTLLTGQVGEVLATVGRGRLSGSLILP